MKPSSAILLLAILGASRLRAEDVLMCGLGPAPGSRDFGAWTERIEKQRQDKGYLLVCEAQLDRYRFESEASADNAVVTRLGFRPHSLQGTAFENMKLLGSIADGFSNGRASMYRRVFRGADGEVITFSEFSLYGGATSVRGRSDGLLTLRGVIAQLTVVQTQTGRGFSQLEWQEGSTQFEVTIDRGSDEERTKDRLIRLAESLPPIAQWSRVP